MFDLFPYELFYEIFEYLTLFDILNAFKGLNKRIDILLIQYPKSNLNLKSWPKSLFDFICKSIYPEQIRSLILSNDDDTSKQINLFFKLFYIQQFINLESLILIEITEQDLNKIITKLNFLSKLTYLSIKIENGLIPKIEIESLKSLSIDFCSISQLQQILLSIPILTNLNVKLINNINSLENIFPPPTEIRQLKIELPQKSNIELDDIKILFQSMPKLYKFTFIAGKNTAKMNFIRGDKWEYLIRIYLPQLKEFNFRIHLNLDTYSYTYGSAGRIPCPSSDIKKSLSTFQTPFWLKEKEWFINCDHHYLRSYSSDTCRLHCVHFYTLPFCDKLFYLSLLTTKKTNVFKDDYSTIQNLYLSFNKNEYDKEITKSYYFSNLDSLIIQNLYKLISINNFINLSKIKHLTIKQNSKIGSEEFFSYILIHSIKLESIELSWYTLKQITNNFKNEKVCLLLNKQIKYLNLLNMIINNDQDNYKSIEILKKIFSKNLEKLSLSVSSMNYIPLLLNEMTKLYSVKIEFNPSNVMINDEELSMWLRQNVPRLKNFTYRIRQATETRICLLLWIGD